mmetsp:Transcript_18153/g.16062  ORF Transcript_18153/g.16062 Transcript_18153/m.16062 type:complete len:87 (+) Transcript_18153:952-1212(+)
MTEGSGENAIYKLMKMPILAYSPIINELEKYHEQGIDICFVYGDRDWIDTNMNGTHISQQLRDKGEKVFIIDDCDHHLYLDNPVQL